MSEKRNTQYMFGGAMRRVVSGVDGEIRCLGCMGTYPEEYEICPTCGYVEGSDVENALHIYPGTILNEKYIVGKVLGQGGFGVTYLAWDTVLQTKVAIKEYIPSEFSTRSPGQTRITVFSGGNKQFNDGKEKFIEESKRLAVFRGEPGIVEIYDSFEENETAYLVMEHLDGETLKQKLDREGKIEPNKAIEMLMPVMRSLEKVHEAGIIHRDIAPDNIFLTKTGEVKLIDFGASRHATTSRSKSLTVIIKQGYSAEEQYRSNGDQGPHTDIYSLGAVMYKMITGITPPDAMERSAQYEKSKKDMLVPISKVTKDITKNQETAIYNAMNVRIADRTSNVAAFAGELLSAENVKRRKIGIKKLDPLTWPLWAKIGLPVGIIAMIILMILLSLGIIGPKQSLQKDYVVPDGQTLIPDVIGKSIEKAESLLGESNLIYTIKDKVESNIPKETVMMQNPDAFNITDMGTAIELTLSDGNGTAFVVDVTGKPIEEATVILEELGFKVKTKEEAHKEIAPGAVVSQSIEAGKEAEKGSEITLVVSTGSDDINTNELVKVPELIGKNFDEAIAILTENNLYYSKEEIYDASRPANLIMRTNPVAGEEVNAGTEIRLTVNMGAKTLVLKNYTYRNLESAKAELESQGIVVNVKYEENKNIAQGTIISSQPGSGTTIKVGSTVVFTVSKGYTVTVPDVKGMKYDAAQSKLTTSGLASSIRREASETVDEGKVISQSVAANTKVAQGTLVVLVVSSGSAEKNDPTPPAPVKIIRLEITTKPTKTIYYVGDTFVKSGLQVTAKYSDGSSKDVTNQVSVSAPDMSTRGSKTVVVSYEGITASFAITVNPINITLTTTMLSIKVGETGKLIAQTTPSGYTVTWSSSNPSIATVSNDGTVTAKATGNATITATIKRGSEPQSATCSVTVTTKEPETTTSNNTNPFAVPLPDLNLKVGESVNAREIAQKSVSYMVPGADISKIPITWTSSNTSVVTVTGNDGKMTAIAPGKSTITSIATVPFIGKIKFSGTVIVTGAATETQTQNQNQSGSFTVTFNANGGSVKQSSKTVKTGSAYGSLPTPNRWNFTFAGWFKDDGTQVKADTIFNDSKNITLKARWQSGWVEASQVPAGSQISEQKWTYTEIKTSTFATMPGWIFVKKDANGYSEEKGPVYKDPSGGGRKVRKDTIKDESSGTTYYKYYHQIWPTGEKHEIKLTQKLGPYARYTCPKCKHSNMIWTANGQETEPKYIDCWYYQDPITVYYFKKDNLESTSEVKASDTITNVKKWVKYIVK